MSLHSHRRVLAPALVLVVAAALALMGPLPALAQSAPTPAGDGGGGGVGENACFLGVICENPAAWWCRLAIDVNNAACGVFGAPNIADTVSTILRVTLDPTHLSGLLMLLVATIMAILLLIQQLMRLALVDVLLILAPLAAVLW